LANTLVIQYHYIPLHGARLLAARTHTYTQLVAVTQPLYRRLHLHAAPKSYEWCIEGALTQAHQLYYTSWFLPV